MVRWTGSEALPGAVREDQHPAAVEEAVLELSRVARPVAEGQLTQAVTQTCSQSDNRFKPSTLFRTRSNTSVTRS